MRIHNAGKRFLLNTATLLTLINGILYFASATEFVFYSIVILSVLLFGFLVYFFRNPVREVFPDEHFIYSPADGKVVGIGEIHEAEYFNDRRIKVTISMSLLDIHINRYPIGGIVKYYRYKDNNYLNSWSPTSSTHSERSSVVLQSNLGKEIMINQSSGYGRTVVCFAREGSLVQQGEELGVIKFGNIIEIILPLDAAIKVEMGQKLVANSSVIAKF